MYESTLSSITHRLPHLVVFSSYFVGEILESPCWHLVVIIIVIECCDGDGDGNDTMHDDDDDDTTTTTTTTMVDMEDRYQF